MVHRLPKADDLTLGRAIDAYLATLCGAEQANMRRSSKEAQRSAGPSMPEWQPRHIRFRDRTGNASHSQPKLMMSHEADDVSCGGQFKLFLEEGTVYSFRRRCGDGDCRSAA